MNPTDTAKAVTITSEQAGAISHAIGHALLGLVAETPATGRPELVVNKREPFPPSEGPMPAVALIPTSGDAFERLYRALKSRLIEDLKVDPILLKLLSVQPEIVVEVEPRVVLLEANTLKGRVARLMAAGWFGTARATGACRQELKRTGADPGGWGNLSDILGDYVKQGFLVRDGSDYLIAPGAKVSEKTLEAR